MRELLHRLQQRISAGQTTAMCRLVETRGSTPQKAGAMMLVFPDGSQAGTLGGGCVEAEVKRRALDVLEQGNAKIVSFQLDSDYGWDDGLICGGRMQVLIDPIRQSSDFAYYGHVLQVLEAAQGLQEAVVFEEDKAHLTAGSAYLFDTQSNLLAQQRGVLENGQAPQKIVQHLLPLAERPRPKAAEGVSYLPVLPRCRLIIVGAGHVGQAVAHWASELDFDVWAVDDREQYASPERFPRAERLIVGPMAQVLPALDITPDTYCLIVTRGHNHDEEALFHVIRRGARYVGMIGSRRKIRLIFDDLLAEGMPPELLATVFAPVGIDIGSQTVPEIAISILAELVAHRNLGGVVPGRAQDQVNCEV